MRTHPFTTASRPGITADVMGSPPHRNLKEMTMFAKAILIAALMLAGTSLTSVADASAAPGQAGWWQSGRYAPPRQSPLCPPDHSYQECFYGG